MPRKIEHPLTLVGEATRDRHDDAARWLKENDPKIWKAQRNLLRRQKRTKRRNLPPFPPAQEPAKP